MMKPLSVRLFMLAVCFATYAKAQKSELVNPSFENEPRAGSTPSGWYDCGFKNASPTDIQPGAFGVNKRAYDGETYLGMTTKQNGTYESVGQKLTTPLLQDAIYTFSLYACRIDMFQSPVADHPYNYMTDFTSPCIIRIYGSSAGTSDTEVLLGESGPVDNLEWKKFDFSFMIPIAIVRHIRIEAYYSTDEPAYGNLMIDNCSAFSTTGLEGNFLYNPSLEDAPDTGHNPDGWYNCGSREESPGDILPGAWGIETPAQDKKTYVGLALKKESAESIGQRLATPLLPGKIYRLSFYACLQDTAVTVLPDFSGACKLKIWGGEARCDKAVLLGESELINHLDWRQTVIEMVADDLPLSYLLLEVSPADDSRPMSYLLIDNLKLEEK